MDLRRRLYDTFYPSIIGMFVSPSHYKFEFHKEIASVIDDVKNMDLSDIKDCNELDMLLIKHILSSDGIYKYLPELLVYISLPTIVLRPECDLSDEILSSPSRTHLAIGYRFMYENMKERLKMSLWRLFETTISTRVTSYKPEADYISFEFKPVIYRDVDWFYLYVPPHVTDGLKLKLCKIFEEKESRPFTIISDPHDGGFSLESTLDYLSTRLTIEEREEYLKGLHMTAMFEAIGKHVSQSGDFTALEVHDAEDSVKCFKELKQLHLYIMDYTVVIGVPPPFCLTFFDIYSRWHEQAQDLFITETVASQFPFLKWLTSPIAKVLFDEAKVAFVK